MNTRRWMPVVGLFAFLGLVPAAAAQAPTPPEAYRRVETWVPRPQSRPAGEMTAPVGVDVDTDGTVYVVDAAEATVHVLSSTGQGLRTFGGPGGGFGSFRAPTDVDVAGGRLYVTDTGNSRVQVLDAASGRFQAEWKGLGRPWAIAVGQDRAYISDAAAPRITVVDRAGRLLETWDAAASALPFVSPRGLAIGADGRVYVADPGAALVIVLADDGTLLGTLDRGTTDPQYAPQDVAVDGQAVYAVSERQTYAFDDLSGGRVWRAGPYHVGGRGVAIGPGAGLVVTIQDSRSVFSGVEHHASRLPLRFDPDLWGTVPVALGAVRGPRRIAAAADGGAYLLDAWPRVQRLGPAGVPVRQFRANAVTDVAVAPGDDVYVVEPAAVSRRNRDGTPVWSWPAPAPGAWLGAGAAGPDLLVADLGREALVRLATDGTPAERAQDGVIVDVAAGGGRALVADREAGALRVLDAAGVELGRWPFPGRVIRVAGARDGSAWFALTADGWVWKYAAGGALRAAWDGSPDGAPVDLDVDARGRVLVADGAGDRVLVYAPDPAETPPVPPSPGDRCDLLPEKTAAPPEVTVGQPVTVTLAVTGDCPSEAIDLDLMLVVDRSGSMAGAKMAAAQSAAVAFTGELDFAHVRAGLVQFNADAEVVQPLTDRRAALVRAIAALESRGDTEIGLAMRAARLELAGPRGRPAAAKAIVLLTDGRPRSVNGARDEAAAARAAGITVFTIGLGADVDGPLLEELAGAEDRYFESPTEAELARVFSRIARRLVTGTLLREVTIADVVPPNMAYVVGSAVPAAGWDGTTLRWTFTDIPAAGLRLRYQVRPLQSGLWPTNVRAHADYTDGVAFRGSVAFPVPRVRVTGDRAVYLPFVITSRCPKQRADIVLVLDTSTSMLESTTPGGATKLDAARQAARTFLGFLDLPDDQAAIVGFDTEARTAQPLTGDRGALERAIDALGTQPGTRIDRGLAEAARALGAPGRRPGNAPIVVLLTDGRPVAGTEPDVLARAAQMRAAGVALFAVGLGADADGGLLVEAVGDPTRYLYAPGQERLAGVYRDIAWSLPCR